VNYACGINDIQRFLIKLNGIISCLTDNPIIYGLSSVLISSGIPPISYLLLLEILELGCNGSWYCICVCTYVRGSEKNGFIFFFLAYKERPNLFRHNLLLLGFSEIRNNCYYRSGIKCPLFAEKLRWSDDKSITPNHTKKYENRGTFPFLFLVWCGVLIIITPSEFFSSEKWTLYSASVIFVLRRAASVKVVSVMDY
jgi:hypothetical protein